MGILARDKKPGIVDPNQTSPISATVWDIIQLERSDQRKLCDDMELIANQLPDDVDVDLYERIYEKLRHNLPIYHENEEALFEYTGRHESPLVEVTPILRCVRLEHATHNCFADEIYEFLDVLSAGSSVREPSTIGYMLRSCFHSIRRHLTWEDLTLMPVVRQILTTDDHSELLDKINENRQTIGLNLV